MNVLLTDDGEADIADGFWFYERQAVGLGDYFRSSIISDIDSLAFFGGIHEVQFDFLSPSTTYVRMKR